MWIFGSLNNTTVDILITKTLIVLIVWRNDSTLVSAAEPTCGSHSSGSCPQAYFCDEVIGFCIHCLTVCASAHPDSDTCKKMCPGYKVEPNKVPGNKPDVKCLPSNDVTSNENCVSNQKMTIIILIIFPLLLFISVLINFIAFFFIYKQRHKVIDYVTTLNALTSRKQLPRDDIEDEEDERYALHRNTHSPVEEGIEEEQRIAGSGMSLNDDMTSHVVAVHATSDHRMSRLPLQGTSRPLPILHHDVAQVTQRPSQQHGDIPQHHYQQSLLQRPTSPQYENIPLPLRPKHSFPSAPRQNERRKRYSGTPSLNVSHGTSSLQESVSMLGQGRSDATIQASVSMISEGRSDATMQTEAQTVM